MTVLNMANRIYSSGKLVYRIFLNTVLVYIDNFQVFKKRVLDDGGISKETPIVFNDEKLLLTPNAYKTGKIYSALPHDGSGDFTFSRNSSATYIEEGVIKYVQENVPRIQDGKILIEGQSTNINNYSETFSNDWLSSGTPIITYNATIAPDGSNNGIRVQGVSPPSRIQRPFTLNGVNTISTFVKHNGSDAYVTLRRSMGSDHAVFKISPSGVTLDFAQGGVLNTTIEPYANDWYRVSTTFNGGDYLQIYLSLYYNNYNPFYIWGTVLEYGDSPTSYIPTNGTVVTRLADIATVTPPQGVTEIIETIDGVDNTITVVPPTYQLPDGEINKVIMK